jgi:hypothetical protein
MMTPWLVRCAFCILAAGVALGWLPSSVWAQRPETGTALKPLRGEELVDSLTGSREKPILIDTRELPPLPAPSFDPATLRDPAATLPELPANKSLRMPLASSIFLFGQVQKDQDWMPLPATGRMIGDTGVAWKLPSLAGAELLFRCGPEMTYERVLRSPDRSALPLRSQWLRLDLQARWSLLGPVGLECQGTAIPALADYERDRIIQDIRAVVPVGKSGQLQFGAKRIWENNAADSKPWSEETQIYGGFRLGW